MNQRFGSKRSLLPFALALLGLGCAETHKVARPIAPLDLLFLQQETNGQDTTVAYTASPAGVAASARQVTGQTQVDRDVVRVLDRQQSSVIPLSQVREIHRTDHWSGMREGIVVGGLAGVVSGGLLGYAGGRDDCEHDKHTILCLNRPQSAVLIGILLAVPGAVIGAVAGAIRGQESTWSFDAGAH